MTTATTSPWPPPSGLSTKTVSKAQTVLPLASSTRIAAPASLVFDAILSVADYPKWNTFCPKVTIRSEQSSDKMELGTQFTFHVVMDASKPDSRTETNLVCCDVSTPEARSEYISREVLEGDGSWTADLGRVYRVGWKGDGGLIYKVLNAERVHEVVVVGERECEVRTWENQAGPVAYAVKLMYAKTLNQKFEDWVNGLKKFCEGKVATG